MAEEREGSKTHGKGHTTCRSYGYCLTGVRGKVWQEVYILRLKRTNKMINYMTAQLRASRLHSGSKIAGCTPVVTGQQGTTVNSVKTDTSIAGNGRPQSGLHHYQLDH
jgi:hypothetical protein